jgi:hypothetical protein
MKWLARAAVLGLGIGLGVTAIHAAPDTTASTIEARQVIEDGRAALRHVLYLREMARKEKDIIKLSCINDKLVMLKAQVNVVERLQTDEMTNPGIASQITQAGVQIHSLRDEADGCAGDQLGGSLESSNSFTGPTPPDNPFGNPFEPVGGVIEPPGYASPFD